MVLIMLIETELWGNTFIFNLGKKINEYQEMVEEIKIQNKEKDGESKNTWPRDVLPWISVFKVRRHRRSNSSNSNRLTGKLHQWRLKLSLKCTLRRA